MQYKILLVEDDKIIAEEIEKHLMAWGYEIISVQNFNKVLEEFATGNPQLVLMDISLPYYNGFYWCQEIRKISKVPIIFVSSAGENMNIVMAMNMGADDYITKPFDLQVLAAKIQAMLRRTYSFQAPTDIKEHDGVILNMASASLEVREQHIELTKNEFRILQILFDHIGEVVSREDIMKHLWDSDCFVDDNTLAVNMTRLRKKLQEYGLEDYISTKKGIGYFLS